MCSHSAPPLIIRLHSAVSWPKSEARTEGEIIARGMVVRVIDAWSAADGHKLPRGAVLGRIQTEPWSQWYKVLQRESRSA